MPGQVGQKFDMKLEQGNDLLQNLSNKDKEAEQMLLMMQAKRWSCSFVGRLA